VAPVKGTMYLPPPGQSRRGFLKRGIWGSALLALAGGGYLALRPSKKVPLPPEGLLALDETEYAVVQALAERIVPARPHFPSVDQVRVAFNVDRILARTDAGASKELKQLLQLFESALPGFLFGGRLQPFTRLPPDEQDAALREWRDSRIVIRRTGFQALRVVVLAGYYSSPLSWSAVGYSGPPAGFWQREAPLWKGEGPRPDGNGVFHAEAEP
jgi:hypothetical protein